MTCRAARRERGSTLLEVLIALVVISFGVLGHAGLQAAALKVNQGALLRSQATSLAYEVLDRMRANRAVALNGGYDLAMGGTKTGSSVEAKDIQAWHMRLANALPSGAGSICRRTTTTDFTCEGNGDIFVINIQWVESDESNKERVLRAPISVMGQL
jgi:type IV pilus assembly protein PilV